MENESDRKVMAERIDSLNRDLDLLKDNLLAESFRADIRALREQIIKDKKAQVDADGGGTGAGDGAVGKGGKKISRKAFNKMNPAEQRGFFKDGGDVID